MNGISGRLLGILLVAGTLSAAVAAKAEEVRVIKLRTEKVALFDKPGGAKVGEEAREGFVAGSWTVTGEPQGGFLPVKTAERSAWVKTFAVDTDRRVAVSAECGIVVASARQKVAATRALGEECQK